MDPVTLDQLRVFIAVVEEGSFSAAGRRLARAQSAISYAIANLERLLELQLFDRNGHRPVLTVAGRAVLADARSVNVELGHLMSHAAQMAGGIEPRVSLVVDTMFPMDVILEALGAFRTTYPNVEVVLHTEALGAVVGLVQSGVCQLGITTQQGDQLSLQRTELMRSRMIPVCAPTHPLAESAEPLMDSELQRHVQLVIRDRSPLTDGKDFGVLSSQTWRLADLNTKLQCLRAGFGWGTMPEHSVVDDLETGRLVRMRVAAIAGSRGLPLFLIRLQNQVLGPAARWLESYLLAQSGEPTSN
ncbi:MAG: DNA-binding transcriptional LysR family regulator [Myxococcota bacterium]